MRISNCARKKKQIVLQHFSSDIMFLGNRESGLPKSVCNDSSLQDNSVFRCAHASASRFSSESMACWVSPCFPFWRHFCLYCTQYLGRGDEEIFVSLLVVWLGWSVWYVFALFFRDWGKISSTLFFCSWASASQLCGLTLAPRTEMIVIKIVYPT